MESAPGTMGLGAAASLGLKAAMMLPRLAPVGALSAGEGAGRAARTAGLVFAGLDPDHDLARLRETMRTVAPGSEKKLGVS